MSSPGVAGGPWRPASLTEPCPCSGRSHGVLVSSAASLSTQGVDVEHMAELRGIRFAPSLQQETSEYDRTLTPALEMLVRVLGARGGGGKWVAKGSD